MRYGSIALQVAGAIVGLLLVTAFILARIPSNQYIVLPAGAHPVAPFIRIKGGAARPAKGGGRIDFVDVFDRPASELDTLFPWLHAHASFLPAADFVPPGSTSQAANAAALREMTLSQRIGAAVAERQLGYHVVSHGVVVDNVYDNVPAYAKIEPADVILAADGKPTPTDAALRAAVSAVKPGRPIALRIRRGSHTLVEKVKTVHDPQHPGRALIGILVEQAATIKLPVKVSINLGNVGGPSAGLAFTLAVMEKLGANVTHGYKVAATGEMYINGDVLAIGGVEQKTWGVRDAGDDVFLVPAAGGNAKEAEKFAGPNLKIIPVTSLEQALHALATLPPKR